MEVYSLPLRTRFRGITHREGLLIKGAVGLGEFSPFLEYRRPEIDAWWQAAYEAAELGWPKPIRTEIPVNTTIPAVTADRAVELAQRSGCTTAKIKVADPGQTLADDEARVAAVRDALGITGKIRIDVNGAWDVDQALAAIKILSKYDLEYVEQPCRSVEELAQLRLALARRGSSTLIAADESIRRADDPMRVKALNAADVAVLKVQPLGGVRACLRIAEQLGLPVVVSSAVESSVGLRAGLALAATLPELPYACGLGTAQLLTNDVSDKPLLPVSGKISLQDVSLATPDSWRATDDRRNYWISRVSEIPAAKHFLFD